MRETVEVPLPGSKIQVKAIVVARLLRAAFNTESGACNRWIAGDVTGEHTASDTEDRRRIRLAQQADMAPCWYLLVLREACFVVPYADPAPGAPIKFGTLDRTVLGQGLVRLHRDAPLRFRTVVEAGNVTPSIADRVIQLSLFGRMVYPLNFVRRGDRPT